MPSNQGSMGGYSVQEIIVYPVKACRGVNVSRAAISHTGFLFDREWMVVSAEKGRLIAQVMQPKMAAVTPSLPSAAFEGRALPADAKLEIQAPGMPALRVPIARPRRSTAVDVYIYGWEGKGVDEGSMAASWWTSYLGRPSRLVRFHPTLADRQVQHAPDGYRTGFANTGQFLLASEASLQDLNARLPNAILMNRFRPNFVVRGSPAFEEDRWHRFSIGSEAKLCFSFVHPCARCKVPTIDQERPEARRTEEPLRTLGEFRTGEQLRVNVGGAKRVFFGTYFVCDDTRKASAVAAAAPSVVAVGEPLHVLQLN